VCLLRTWAVGTIECDGPWYCLGIMRGEEEVHYDSEAWPAEVLARLRGGFFDLLKSM
jgi:hypothetical protein